MLPLGFLGPPLPMFIFLSKAQSCPMPICLSLALVLCGAQCTATAILLHFLTRIYLWGKFHVINILITLDEGVYWEDGVCAR